MEPLRKVAQIGFERKNKSQFVF